MQNTTELGIDNLVEIAVDGVTVYQHVKGQLKDGFQPLSDIPAIVFSDFGKLQNIYEKHDEALAEIANLSPDELEEFEVRVSEATGLPNTGISGKVRQSLRIAARSYRMVLEAKGLFFEIKDLIRREAA